MGISFFWQLLIVLITIVLVVIIVSVTKKSKSSTDQLQPVYKSSQSRPVHHRSSSVPPPRDFGESIKVCFEKYADFNGRASRSEFWFFVLFFYIIYIPLLFIPFAPILWSVVCLVPSFAVTARRFHDVGQSGWWQALIVPLSFILVGLIWLIIWGVQQSDPHDNGY